MTENPLGTQAPNLEASQTRMPAVSLCVNFCEAVHPNSSETELVDLLARTCQEAGFPHCERLYVGSYFCENYFLGLHDSFHETIRTICSRYDMGATLVVPVIGQAFLERAEHRIGMLLTQFGDVYDEIVVNDVACFSALQRWLAETNPMPSATVDALFGEARPTAQPRLGLGRLFSKELRDARFPKMFGAMSVPRLSAEAMACLGLQQESMPGTWPLVEVDPLSETVQVSKLLDDAEEATGLPSTDQFPSAEVAIHLPFCYATTGRNCGPASFNEPDSEKFRLGRGCGRHCLRVAQGYLTDKGVRYIKHGRTYYFENPSCNIAGTDRWRIVYAAAHETMRYEQPLRQEIER